MALCAYGLATPGPVLKYRIMLQEILEANIVRCVRWGREKVCPRLSAYAVSGTDAEYGARARCTIRSTKAA
eukprot:3940292-Rhodomonas_salina.2